MANDGQAARRGEALTALLARRGAAELGVALLVVAATLAWLTLPPRYTATALIETGSAARAGSEAALFAGRIAEAGLDLGAARLAVRAVDGSGLVAVSVTARAPAAAARLAGAVAQARIAAAATAAKARKDKAAKALDLDIAAAHAALTGAQQARTRYINTQLAALTADPTDPNLAALLARRDGAEAARNAAVARADAAQAALDAADWPKLSTLLPDVGLAGLETQRATLAARRDAAKTGSDQEKALAAGLARVEARLSDAARSAIAGLRKQAVEAAREAVGLRGEIRASLGPDVLPDLERYNADIAAAQTRVDALERARAEAARTPASSGLALARAATPPAGPDRGTLLGPLALALVLGLAAGLALTTALEALQPVRSARVLARRLPLAGAVPERADLAEAVRASPRGPEAASLRLVLDRAERAARPGEGGTVLAVLPAAPRAGSSTTALALARLAAQAGRRVLLVDADLAAPSQHLWLGTEPAAGLADYLASEGEGPAAQSCFGTDPGSSLEVVFGRPGAEDLPPAPLFSAPFRRLLDDARARFDLVILDLPAAGTDDAQHALARADAALLVVRAGRWRPAALTRLRGQLTARLPQGAGLTAALV
jgi:Mrp family chromosome partitioning ATPase